MAYPIAREFLARVLPWPDQGQYFINLHWTFGSEQFAKPAWGGRAFKDLDALEKGLDFNIRRPGTKDVYFCTSAQLSAEEKVTDKGYRWHKAIRAQENVAVIKLLAIDIDVKDAATGYGDIKEAALALTKFCDDVQLPKPTAIVASGGGLHVYWTMDRALTRHEWQPLADALAEATRQKGLKCDTGVTVDSARLLRVPETLNHKTTPPRPVRLLRPVLDFDYSVERLKMPLSPFMRSTPLMPRAPIRGDSELSAGISSGKAPPVDLAMVDCPFLQDAVTTGGKDLSNPLWNLTTLIAIFTQDERADAHKMADQHPGYTVESTDELFDRKARERETKNLGWPSCQSIKMAGCTLCDTCQFKDHGRSPLNFSKLVPAAPTPDLPSQYVRNQDGTISVKVLQEDGTMNLFPLLEGVPMTDGWVRLGPPTLNFSSVNINGKRQVSIPIASLTDDKATFKILAERCDITIEDWQRKAIRNFLVAWMNKLQTMVGRVVKSEPFGWRSENGELDGFIYGGRSWGIHGDHGPAATPDPHLEDQYAPRGSPQAWYLAAKMITDQKRPQLEAIVASAFAAPLVRFTGHSGLLLSAYSAASGIGKTTALDVAQAVWGSPRKGKQGLTDTSNSVVHKIGQLRALPLYWDELKTENDTKNFTNIVFQVTGGKEKSRMRRDGALAGSGSWQTMVVVCSNDSLIDAVTNATQQSVAGIYRMFEFEVTPGVIGQLTPSVAQRLLDRLNDNYGQAGLVYAQYLGANFKAVEEEISTYQVSLEEKLKSQNDERFWISTITCLVIGARLANRIGVATFDEPALESFLLNVLAEMRALRRQTSNDMETSDNVSAVLGEFLQDAFARHTLQTNVVWRNSSKPGPSDIRVIGDTSRLDGIWVQRGVDDAYLRVSKKRLSNWLRQRELSVHLFSKSLEQKLGAVKRNAYLGSGTAFGTHREWVYDFDAIKCGLADAPDNLDQKAIG